MRHDNVKPCPFCGCSSIQVRKILDNFRACCNSCEAVVMFQDSKQAAATRWSTRVEEKQSGGLQSV